MPPRLPASYAPFQELADDALERWFPGATVNFYDLKSRGYSGAAVVKVDVSVGSTGELPSGQYILKLSRHSTGTNQDTEITAYNRAVEKAPEFAAQHIPQLCQSFDDADRGYAMLYEIAGRSLDAYVATDIAESPGLLEICQTLPRDLLQHWSDAEPIAEASACESLQSWLGYRLDPAHASSLHEFARGLAGHRPRIFVVNDDVLPNPLQFCKFLGEQAPDPHPILWGLEHGDLHGGNIIVHRRKPQDGEYWILDFAQARSSGVGFDLAYLELAQILYCLGDRDPALVLEVLRVVDEDLPNRLVPPGTKWLIDVVRAIRKCIEEWIRLAHPRRGDDLHRQFELARVAAGINWANTNVSDSWKTLALFYAGWAAKCYLKKHASELEEPFWRWSGADTVSDRSARDSPGDQAIWEQLWGATGGFSPGAGRLVIVAQALHDIPLLSSLGQLPISAAIDLDPLSQERGLFAAVGPVLQVRRSVHVSSDTFPSLDFTRGTAWLMAAGWPLKSEPSTDLPRWRYTKLPNIRQLIRELDSQTNPDRLVVLSFAGASMEQSQPLARLEHVVEAIEEGSRGRASVFHIGPAPLNARITHTHLPISVAFLAGQLARVFGAVAGQAMPDVPAKEGRRYIPLETIRSMEENFHLLHSRILDDVGETSGNDEFWRGNPPTWFDLHSGVDIRRAMTSSLEATLQRALDDVRNRTILFHHMPGAGGSTVALRVAWDLRDLYPTVILRRMSPALADRLQDLYNLTERPVLLMADAGRLTETAREDLYRELQSRNVRVVILYVRRVFQTTGSDLTLADPMDPVEARTFQEAFSKWTVEPDRLAELRRITNDDDYLRYRTPFFYGLTTFERDFKGTHDYVTNHVGGIRGKVRELLEYLGLVTIYSNSGLHRDFIRQMLGLPASSALSLEDELGDGPAHLLVQRNGLLRLSHQVIAEQVLDYFQGSNWRLELKLLTVDFISDLARNSDSGSLVVLDLLRQMFVDRQGTESDDVEERPRFSPLIETIDSVDSSLGHRVLLNLTEEFPQEAHFWNHLGRHQIYRVGRDLDKAEEYLLRATALSPEDFIHHHTLGLVRRYRVKRMLNSRRAQQLTSVELIEMVRSTFDAAVQSFERTREINEENVYAYITQVQMILDVAAKLKAADSVVTIADVGVLAQEWVQEQIATASALLDSASELYATLEKTNNFLTSCVADLQTLYNNLDNVIRVWELAHERSGGSASSRRALANAYVTRADRHWSSLSQAELRRVTGLMESNLRQAGRRDDDYRLWFEAYKLLPEYSVEEALSRLSVWSKRFASWRAYYYIYVLHFLAWFSGRTENTDEYRDALERCEATSIGRRNISHTWLASGPHVGSLVASGDLGVWDRGKNFWSETESLRRVNGVVSVIHGQQKGSILIDGRVQVFFVPGKDFSANHDENKAVNFFVGFSASGIRAWNVRRDWVAEGSRRGTVAPSPELFAPMVKVVPDQVKLERARSLQREAVFEFVRSLVAARTSLDAPLSIEQIAAQVSACFGLDDVVASLGYSSARALLEDAGQFVFQIDGDGVLVRDPRAPLPQRRTFVTSTRLEGRVFQLGPRFGFIIDANNEVRHFAPNRTRLGHWSKLVLGCEVDFKPTTAREGKQALDVQWLRGGTMGALLKEKAGAIVRRLAESRSEVTLDDVAGELHALFGGRLEIPEYLGSLLSELDGVQFVGPSRKVLFNYTRAAGRVANEPVPASKGASPRPPQATSDQPTDLALKAKQCVREILVTAPGALNLAQLGSEVLSRLGLAAPLRAHLREPFNEFVKRVDGVELRVDGDRVEAYLQPAASVIGSEAAMERPVVRGVPRTVPLVSPSNETFPRNLDRQEIEACVRLILAEAPGQRMYLSSLGLAVNKRLRLAGPLAPRVGGSFARFVAGIADVEINANPPEVVSLRQKAPL